MAAATAARTGARALLRAGAQQTAGILAAPTRWGSARAAAAVASNSNCSTGSTGTPGGQRRWYTGASLPRPMPLRRALLYLPGHDERKIAKAAQLDVDTVCLDLEDAVAHNRREDARQSVAKALATVDFGRSERAVRINPPQTAEAERDLEVLFEAPVMPDCIVMPKVETPDDLDWLFALGYQLGRRRKDDAPPMMSVVTMCESAIGLLNLRSICELDKLDLSESLYFEHDGIIFGGDDYAADIGAMRCPGNPELLYARQHVVACGKAFGLQVIDVVNINFKNMTEGEWALEAEALQGYRFGFTGKQTIHPAQVPIVQDAFTPSEAEIARAQDIVTAFRAHEADGAGVFVYEGKMIDMPTVKNCEKVLRIALVAGRLG